MLNHLETEIHAKQEKPTNDKLDNHQDDKQIQKSHHHQEQQQRSHSPNYNVNLQYNPQIPEAGHPTILAVDITEQRTGDTVNEFETIHDKFMHIIIVADDRSYFAHIHPKFETTISKFTINHIFPESGKYKIWIDFKPKGGSQTIDAFKLDVTGIPLHESIPITNDNQLIKNIGEEYKIGLKTPKEIRTNEDVEFTFNILDVSGNPVSDLEPLMGAGGHSVIISSNIREFLHVHPIEEVDSDWKGGPAISFKTTFTKQGIYKVWGQFQHHGRLITAGFILEVV